MNEFYGDVEFKNMTVWRRYSVQYTVGQDEFRNLFSNFSKPLIIAHLGSEMYNCPNQLISLKFIAKEINKFAIS